MLLNHKALVYLLHNKKEGVCYICLFVYLSICLFVYITYFKYSSEIRDYGSIR